MATRNTSSSDALLDISPAYLIYDWWIVAVPALTLAEVSCQSRNASFTTSWKLLLRLDRLQRGKGKLFKRHYYSQGVVGK